MDSALTVARLLRLLLPRDAEVAALLALMLLVCARRAGRVAPDGRLLLLAEQDRSRWDAARIAEGAALLGEALRRPPSRWAVEAAIAAVHAEAPTWAATDWTEITGLYDVLLRLWPSPVIRLNRAVAIGLRDGPAAGLLALEPLLDEPALAGYGYLSAARADFLRRLGRVGEAALAYEEALALTANEVERAFLESRLSTLRGT
jgi:RNA polymerase sigma-70 factor (ECF subfamily)